MKTPYVDQDFRDFTSQVEEITRLTVQDVKADPYYYAELVNDLLFHWVYNTFETPMMHRAKAGLKITMDSLKK